MEALATPTDCMEKQFFHLKLTFKPPRSCCFLPFSPCRFTSILMTVQTKPEITSITIKGTGAAGLSLVLKQKFCLR